MGRWRKRMNGWRMGWSRRIGRGWDGGGEWVEDGMEEEDG